MNIFEKDDSFQRDIRNKLLKPFYQEKTHESRFVFCDKGKLADILQRELSVDTIMQLPENRIYGVEEKIVRWPGYNYDRYTLEIMSCTVPGREKQGWMHYSKADLLLYCFVQKDGSLEAHAIPFQKLKKWFFENDNYKKYTSTLTNQINKTECKKVPIADVFKFVHGCKIFHMQNVEVINA